MQLPNPRSFRCQHESYEVQFVWLFVTGIGQKIRSAGLVYARSNERAKSAFLPTVRTNEVTHVETVASDSFDAAEWRAVVLSDSAIVIPRRLGRCNEEG